jgi:hypothetical protein
MRLEIMACTLLVLSACYAGNDSYNEVGTFGEEAGQEAETGSSGDGDPGDGDGDPGDGDSGDGDGDSGDGDGDGDSGDGDGDTGDGDGDSGDGDGDTGDTGNPGNPYDDAAQHCVDVINMYRASIDVPPVQRWVDAEPCSNDEAQSDAMTNTPHGAFGQCGEFAQNECPGWPGPVNQLLDGCLAQMWAEGPGEPFSEHGHYINMSNPAYTQVACGFYETNQGTYWAVQNFK